MKPWVVVSLLGVFLCLLLVLFFPTGGYSKEAARKTMCLSNMKQIGTGMLLYADQNDGLFPGQSWVDATLLFVKQEEAHTCSIMARDGKKWGYAMNADMVRKNQSSIKNPEKVIVLFECNALAKNVVANLAARTEDRHPSGGTGSNVVRADSSARFIRKGVSLE